MAEPLVFDHIILVCKCGRERTFYPDRALRGADELIAWLKTKPTRCVCNSPTCDVKAHVKGDPCWSCGAPSSGPPGDGCEKRECHAAPAPGGAGPGRAGA